MSLSNQLGRATRLAAVILAAALPMGARAENPTGMHEPALPASAQPTTLVDAVRGGARFITNGGFEDGAEGEQPDGWITLRRAFREKDPQLAHSGDYSVRSSTLFGYIQVFESPAAGLQNVTVVGFAQPEFTGEAAGITLQQFDSSGAYLGQRRSNSPLVNGASGYSEFWTPHSILPRAATLQMLTGGQAVNTWLRFDDLRLYHEGFADHHSDFGEEWTFEGGATREGDDLVLPAGASISQRVAYGLMNETYFVSGVANSAAKTQLRIEDAWLQRDPDDPNPQSDSIVDLAPGQESFSTTLDRPVGFPSGLSRVTITNIGTGQTVLHGVARGFAKAEPAVWYVGGSSSDTDLRASASWSGAPTTATIEILTDTNEVLANLPVALDRESAIATWNGAGAVDGNFRVRTTFEGASGEQVTLVRPLEIRTLPNEPSSPPVFDPGGFPRAAWLWFIGSENNEDIRAGIRHAKEDGYELGILHLRVDQVSDAAAILASEKFPVFIYVPELRAVFTEFIARGYFSQKEYLETLHDYFGPLGGSPYLRGIYVYDEPTSPDEQRMLRRTHLAVANDPDLGGFSLCAQLADPAFASPSVMESPAFCYELYPYIVRPDLPDSESLIERTGVLNTAIRNAADLGRKSWFIPQGFEDSPFSPFRPVPLAMHRAMLHAGLLAGAKGMFVFTHNSINAIEGLRGPDGAPTRKHPAYVEFNALMERIGELVDSFNTPTIDNRLETPILASLATANGGGNYYFVLNTDEDSTHTLFMDLQPAPKAGVHDVAREIDLEADEDEGHFIIELAPGDLALLDIGNSVVSEIDSANHPESPLQYDITLPVTHEFTATDPSGAPLAVTGLDVNEDTTMVAISHPNPFVATRPLVWTLHEGGKVTSPQDAPKFPSQSWRFLPGNEMYAAGDYLGFEILPRFAGAITGAFLGHSGGAFAVSPGQDATWWVAQFQYGIRRLSRSNETFTTEGIGFANIDVYDDVVAPFDGDSAAVLVRNQSVNRVVPGAESEDEHTTISIPRAQHKISMSSTGVGAIPRHQRGVTLVTFAADGTPTGTRDLATEAIDATACAWLDDKTLAVADGVRNVRFYRIEKDSVQYLCSWRPPANADGNFYIASLAAGENRIIVGFADGRVVVANAGAVASVGLSQSGWIVR